MFFIHNFVAHSKIENVMNAVLKERKYHVGSHRVYDGKEHDEIMISPISLLSLAFLHLSSLFFPHRSSLAIHLIWAFSNPRSTRGAPSTFPFSSSYHIKNCVITVYRTAPFQYVLTLLSPCKLCDSPF